MRYNNSETMGIFGFSTEEKIGKFVLRRLRGTLHEKKLKDFWQASGLNITLIKNLLRTYMSYMASNQSPSMFSIQPDANGDGGEFTSKTITLASRIVSATNVDGSIVIEFLRAMYVLARDGKIPFSKWNPKGYKEATELQKTFKTEQTIGDVAKSTMNKFVIVAIVGVAIYGASKMKTSNRSQ